MTDSNPFEGKLFAATGQWEDISQAEVQMSVEVRGGVFKSGVTKKTDVLVAGEKGGAKLAKAQELGVRVIDIREFRAMCAAVPITDEMKRRYLG